ncbi:MAG: lamin tail domain-containing protein [Ferruginibacter sp.]
MRKFITLLFLFSIVRLAAIAQFTDNFIDGNFTANPAWVGNTADWIVNPALQLQSNNTVASSVFYLSTVNTKATSAEWNFYCQVTFNPSGANYIDVFLTASASDLTLNSTSGYFVRIGNTDDEISLYRKDATGAVTKIIDGINGILNTSNNVMTIKVTRTAANLWNLQRDLAAGTNYTSEGTVTDATFTTSSFFGILVKQSTSSFFQRHFFDDIEVKDYVPDVTPPAVVSATAVSATMVDVLFNEAVDITSSQLSANYVVNNSIGSPLSAVRDAVNTSLVHLTFATPFPARTNLTVTINGVKDLAGNAQANGSAVFNFFTPSSYDVVIDEIMADPTPIVGLPDAEWIELKNTSGANINLLNWRLAKPSGQSGPMPSYLLKADSFVVVCTSSAVAALSAFGPVISVTSFPSLGNTGDLIFLKSPQGNIIHAVNYTDAWYQNELKKDGGWTLEMIDTKNPCAGMNNWKASVDPKGGTPAKKNSVDAINADAQAPRLLRAYATDSVTVTLVFSEPLDSARAAVPANYTISDGIGAPVSATPQGPLFDHVTLKLARPLLRQKIYTVTAMSSVDCAGNPIATNNTARVGLYEHTDSLDVVINEILFNPKSGGTDWVEIYNRSTDILTLRNIYIANRNTAGAISSIQQLSSEDYLLFPGEFLVITASKALLLRDFIANDPDRILQISSMPSFNDDKGDVIILNEQGSIVDEVAYTEKWHFKLISDREGVSLERIDYNGPSQDEKNWHSAASSVGYGTPTYKNSQYRMDAAVQGTISVTPEIISPDNDGQDDFATITYEFPEGGYVANITIFDATGRPVRYLQRNALSGVKGFYRWDGLGEKNERLNSGIYIIYTEVFNLAGKTKKYKNVIVLARKQF